MNIGVFTYNYEEMTPERLARTIREQGFDCVQLYLNMQDIPQHPSELTEEHCRRVKDAFDGEGLRIVTLGAFGNIGHPDPAKQREAIELALHACKWARALGADNVSTMTGSYDTDFEWNDHPANHTPEAFERVVEAVREMAAEAGRHGLKLCLEPYYHSIVDSAERMLELIRRVDNVAVMYDPGAMVGPDRIERSKEAMTHDFELLYDCFHIAHVEDVRFEDGKPAFLRPGQGGIDWPAYYSLLREYGWSGPVMIEVPDDLEGQRKEIIEALAR